MRDILQGRTFQILKIGKESFLKNTLDYLNENKHIYSKYITTLKKARNNGLNENVLINKTI